MDPLTALRTAVMNKKDIRLEGDTVIINNVSYPGNTSTAFRSLITKTYMDLITLVVCYQQKDVSYQDYMKYVRERKVSLILASEKSKLIDFLFGNGEAEANVDRKLLTSLSSSEIASSSSSLSSSTSSSTSQALEDLHNIEWAIRKEIPFRTRTNVLECSSKNLKDEVFKHFALAWSQSSTPTTAGTTSSSSAAPSSKRPSSSGSATDDEKRARFMGPDGMPNIRGTPIIIVPASNTALINMYNVQAFLERGQWIPPEQARQEMGGNEKPTKITIKRTDSHGNACQYYITDNVSYLQRHDWLKVVAIFAAGPDWQFTGWKWGEKPHTNPDGTVTEPDDCPPVKIFNRALGFHLYFEGDAPHANCQNWAVTPFAISKTKRYLDQGVQIKFWRTIDDHIFVKKPYLLPKGATGPSSMGDK